jgi:hypothetical protein
MKDNKEQLLEDLKRFNSIIGYDITGKKTINEAPEDEEGGEEEFDFGGEEEGGEEAGAEGTEEGGEGDFDFGDEGSPEDEGGEEEGGEEPTDEFGTAGEFSAADDIETEEEDVEEIDVTDIVNKSDEARETAELAAQTSQETNSYVKDLTDKISNLEAQLTKMDSIMAKVSKIESDVKTPEEKLELRSLDSYPFSMKLTDYWSDKVNDPTNNYEVTDGEERTFEITQEDLEDYNEIEVKNSFNPEA